MTSPRHQPVKVLVIDDDEAQGVLVEGLLDLANVENPELPEFVVDQAPRLDVGCRKVVAEQTDVVVLDLSLPDSYGIDTVVEFRRRCPLVPVIVSSGSARPQIADQVLQSGGSKFIRKGTTDGQQLAALILSCIQEAGTSK